MISFLLYIKNMIDKNELRKKAKEIRHSLNMEKLSEDIVKNIKASEIYKSAKHVMIFYPLKNEVNLLGLLSDDKSFYLPKVNGEELLVCPYKDGDELQISDFKTKEPRTSLVNPEILDIIFTPALMIDKSGFRLGYGGGFYDKFLSKNALNSTKIAAVPCALIADTLPSESFDIKVDVTICEKFD